MTGFEGSYAKEREFERRIAAIEARQRDRQEHDPTCSVRSAEKHNAKGMSHQFPGTCNCWLAQS